jgi:hypothetical protein
VARLHGLLFKFHDLFVHFEEAAADADLAFHLVVGLVGFEFVWDFVEDAGRVALDLFYFGVCDGGD